MKVRVYFFDYYIYEECMIVNDVLFDAAYTFS
jgi:hypothetical protein